jgi:hypothetical protein
MHLNPLKRKKSSSINALAPAGSHPKPFWVRGARAHIVLPIAVVLIASFASIGTTASYFSNIQLSAANFFVADPLYFSVAGDTQTLTVGQSEQLFVPTMTLGDDSEPVQYRVNVQMMSGDATLCDALTVYTTAPLIYSGPFLSMATATTSQTGPWALTFEASAQEGIAAGASCQVDLIYKGWGVGSAEGVGYSDTHRVSLTFVYQLPVVSAPANTTDTTSIETPDTSVDTGSTDAPADTTEVQ